MDGGVVSYFTKVPESLFYYSASKWCLFIFKLIFALVSKFHENVSYAGPFAIPALFPLYHHFTLGTCSIDISLFFSCSFITFLCFNYP